MMPFTACGFGAEPLVPPRFTGKERDTESGNDYFGARYYASTMGRFLSAGWPARTLSLQLTTEGAPSYSPSVGERAG